VKADEFSPIVDIFERICYSVLLTGRLLFSVANKWQIKYNLIFAENLNSEERKIMVTQK